MAAALGSIEWLMEILQTEDLKAMEKAAVGMQQLNDMGQAALPELLELAKSDSSELADRFKKLMNGSNDVPAGERDKGRTPRRKG